MIQTAKIIGSGLATIGLVGAGVVFGALILGVDLYSYKLFGFLVFILPIITTVLLKGLNSVTDPFLNILTIVKLYFTYHVNMEKYGLYFWILVRIIFIIMYLFLTGDTCYAMDGLDDQIIRVKEDIIYWTQDYNTLLAVYNDTGFANVPNTHLSPEQLVEKSRLLEGLADGRRNVLSSKSELLKLENRSIPSQLSVKRPLEGSEDTNINKK